MKGTILFRSILAAWFHMSQAADWAACVLLGQDVMEGFPEPISICNEAFAFADELLKQENL